MIKSLIISLIVSLILTLIIEIITSFLLGIRDKDDIIVIICANICTNPVVVYISNCVILLKDDTLYLFTVAILELLALLIEFIIFKKYLNFNKHSPLIISLINNSTSFILGLIL